MYMVGLEKLKQPTDYTISAKLLDPSIIDQQTITFTNTSNPRVIVVLDVPKEVRFWNI